jgi:site-specific recombinase XerC
MGGSALDRLLTRTDRKCRHPPALQGEDATVTDHLLGDVECLVGWQHLLPFFAETRLEEITFDLVERYIAAKLAEREPLSARSINMTVTLLGAILEGAVERELIPRNPARGRGRRVRERAPRRSYLETAAQIEALLAAAGELDRDAARGRRHVERRAMLATLTFAGLRIGELCALRWRDVDLAAGWLRVGESEMGHTDPGLALRVYRQAVRRGEDEKAALRALVEGSEMAEIGRRPTDGPVVQAERDAA